MLKTTIFNDIKNLLDEHLTAIEQLSENEGGRSQDYKAGFCDAVALVKRLSHDLERSWSLTSVYEHPPHPHPRSRTYRSEPADWWIEDTDASALRGFIAQRMSHIESGESKTTRQPAIVFDLDGTLFDVGHRTLGIVKQWLALTEAKRFPEALTRKVGSIGFNHIGYSLSHAFENAGLDLRNPDIMEILLTIERFWRKKFFDGETLVEHDAVYSGAVDFVWFCQRMGIKIVYLTGRSHKVMFDGTIKQLAKFGFPVEGAETILKLNTLTDDSVYKEEAFRTICSKYNVIGNFENEYVNIRGMVQSNPQAMHIIVDSQHSGRPTQPLSERVYRIQSFADQ
jgi:phosphoglycolate phosphatase-like HAD superfamily hydrolase